jgi:hypothetical protein
LKRSNFRAQAHFWPEWHPARGGAEPGFRNLAGYKKAGPILFSTEHRGFADGKPLHIFISDVAVKLTGSDKWMDAQ